ncbi:MAG: hypothetical protein K2Q14_03325 [Gammaproteobacteria bacterium]|nr:hypothetical protein [Gammaproteobacteria bacterium]
MDLYLRSLKTRYFRAKRQDKSKLLDEFCATSGCHRKHAIRLLNTGYMGLHKRPGRQKTYTSEELLEPLKKLWFATDQSCGKRLKSAIELWLP